MRDVFFVSSTVMLVRADLFAELGGFDAEDVPGRRGPRPLLAGPHRRRARDGRARRARAAPPGRHDARRRPRPSSPAVAAAQPAAGDAEVRVRLVARVPRADRARPRGRRGRRVRRSPAGATGPKALIGAWTWNLRNLGELREVAAGRAGAAPRPRHRSPLAPGAGQRAGARLRRRARCRPRTASARSPSAAVDRPAPPRTRLRDPAVDRGARVRRCSCSSGPRSLIFGRVPVDRPAPGWPGVGGLVESFTSAWRYADLGSATPGARAARRVLGARHGAARRDRLRPHDRRRRRAAVRGVRRVAAGPPHHRARAAPRSSPRSRTASTRCRATRSPRVASARSCSTRSRRSSSRACCASAATSRTAPPRRWWRAVVGTGALVALTTAAWPPASCSRSCVAIALALAQPIARGVGELRRAVDGDARRHRRRLRAAAAVAARVPARRATGSPRSGSRSASTSSFSQVLRFQTGPNGAGAVGLGHRRRRAARPRARVRAPARLGDPGLGARPRVVRVRLGPVPLLPRRADAGGRGAARPGRARGLARGRARRRRVHRGRPPASTSGGARSPRSAARSRSSFPVLAFAVDALDGRWHMPPTDWNQNLSWMRSEDASGQFRVLWLGDPDGAPGRPGRARRRRVRRHQRRSGRRPRPRLPPPAGRHERARRRARSTCCASGGSNRVGALLGPMGVRYLAVPRAPGSRASSAPIPAPPALLVALGDQLDLVRLEGPPGLELYENRAWIPGAASLPDGAGRRRGDAGSARPARRRRGARSPVRDGVPGAGRRDPLEPVVRRRVERVVERRRRCRTGACSAGRTATRSTAPGTVSFSYGDQWLRYPAVLHRARARRRRVPAVAGERAVPLAVAAAGRRPRRRVVSPLQRPARRASIVIVVVLGCLLVAALVDRQRLERRRRDRDARRARAARPGRGRGRDRVVLRRGHVEPRRAGRRAALHRERRRTGSRTRGSRSCRVPTWRRR